MEQVTSYSREKIDQLLAAQKASEAELIGEVRSEVSGYDSSRTGASPISGVVYIQTNGLSTVALDLKGNATVIVSDKGDGTQVTLDVQTNGHVLRVTDGPTIKSDRVFSLRRTRGVWAEVTSAPDRAAVASMVSDLIRNDPDVRLSLMAWLQSIVVDAQGDETQEVVPLVDPVTGVLALDGRIVIQDDSGNVSLDASNVITSDDGTISL